MAYSSHTAGRRSQTKAAWYLKACCTVTALHRSCDLTS